VTISGSTLDFHQQSDPEVSVIVVNYGTIDLVVESIESVLARSHGRRTVDLHVVDNASPDGDGDRLRRLHAERAWGTRVVLHFNTENLGFGRANNVALSALAGRATPPRYCFLLNPDARLENEAIDALASFLDEHPEVAAAGAAIARPDGTNVSAAFRFPGVVSEFVQTVNLGLLSRLMPHAKVSLSPDLGQQQVDWVSGAAVMFRFSTLQEIGFFDPDFFLYFEETELMWRLRRAGHAVWHVPSARVLHVAGAATGLQGGRHKSRAQPAYWYDSWRLFHVKTRGIWQARGAALARLVGAGLNIAWHAVFRRPVDVPMHFFQDFHRHVLHPLFLGDPYLARPDGKTTKESVA